MKWFLIFALAIGVCQCGIMKRDDNDSVEKRPFICHDRRGEMELADEQVCDGEEDCKHGDDEGVYACAEKNDKFVCTAHPEAILIDNVQVCDGVSDCPPSPWSHTNVSRDESKFECHDPDTEFVCDDETVIPIELRCNGNNDCPVGRWGMWDNRTRDEDLWECKGEDQFICWEDRSYIDISKVCDGEPDCSPSRWSNTTEDELLYNCPDEITAGKHICWGGEVMVDEDLMCDGNNDCPVGHYGIGSDENAWDCAADDEFVCSSTQTIKESQTCDGVSDCQTEDEYPSIREHYERMNRTEFYCWSDYERENPLPMEKVGDGHNDCIGRDEDEYTCPPESSESAVVDNQNAITRRNAFRKREFNEYLEMNGVNRRSLGRR